MNFEGKNLWNYSNKMFRFQRVSGIHICLFCFCCGIFVHRCCSSPTCAECDGAAFPKQGPLYSGSQGCGTREARLLLLPASSTDRSRTTATSLHSDANWDPLLSLSHSSASTSHSAPVCFQLNPLCTLQVWPWHILQLPVLCRQEINWIYSL